MNSYPMKGFTLVELTLVVAIIGILATIALPAYQDYIVRAKMVEALLMPTDVKSTINDYYKATGRMPANNHEAGLAPASAYRGNYIIGIEVENGAIHIEVDKQHLGLREGRWITLRPQTNNQFITMDIVWQCNDQIVLTGLTIHGSFRTDIKNKYLPASCRYYRSYK